MNIDTVSRRSFALWTCAALLCAVQAHAQTPAQGRIEQGGRLITYQLSPTPEGSGLDARFQVELRDRGALDPTGGRSISGEAALNCAAGLTRLKGMTVHAQSGLKGAVVQDVPRQTTWMRPEMGSLLRVIMISACKTPGAAGVVAARPSQPLVAVAPPVPRFAAPAASTGVGPPPSPAGSPAPVAAPAPARPTTSGAYRIQVGSFPSEAEAERHASRVRTLAAELAAPRLEAARVKGTTYHRVLIDGFSERAAADAACRNLGAQGLPCLVKSPSRRSP